jgi:hypothetical protein
MLADSMGLRTARILRIVFLTVGALAVLLGIGSIILSIVFRLPAEFAETTGRARWGALLYLMIAGTCFYAAVRLKRHRGKSSL